MQCRYLGLCSARTGIGGGDDIDEGWHGDYIRSDGSGDDNCCHLCGTEAKATVDTCSSRIQNMNGGTVMSSSVLITWILLAALLDWMSDILFGSDRSERLVTGL